jgi:hypothetical protein
MLEEENAAHVKRAAEMEDAAGKMAVLKAHVLLHMPFHLTFFFLRVVN